jgi:hypothetical protein
MDDYLRKFGEALHDSFNELSESPAESLNVALGPMKLTDGRQAQVQLVVTTSEEEFIKEVE